MCSQQYSHSRLPFFGGDLKWRPPQFTQIHKQHICIICLYTRFFKLTLLEQVGTVSDLFRAWVISIWACTKRSSNCEGHMLFLTRGPYALLRFPQFCLREIPVFGYAYAVLTRSLWIRFCAQTCSGSLRKRLFSIAMLQHQASFFLA